jgi:hypothetical protein
VYVVGTFTALATNQTIIEQLPTGNAGNMNALVVYASSPASPTITSQPANVRVITNTPATFTVGTTGYPLNYQWYKISGGVTNLITGATNASYVTLPVVDSDVGSGFFVVVSNPVILSTVTSATAYLSVGHMVLVNGYLRNDQFNNLVAGSSILTSQIYPGSAWLAANPPSKTEYLNVFDGNQDLPGNAGQRIYGWFTPPANGDYVFFMTSDDSGDLWLSTDSTSTPVYQIAQNQAWMVWRDWQCGATNSAEYPYFSYGEWRSDQFINGGGQNAYANFNYGWSAYPSIQPDGGVALVGGTKYYIELDNYQGGGGQNAAVTYKLAGSADPSSNSVSLLAGNNIAAAVPDSILPKTTPVIANISVAGGKVVISGGNGLYNEVYNVLSSTNLTTPLANWTVTATRVFDAGGNFSATNVLNPGAPQTFYRLQQL